MSLEIPDSMLNVGSTSIGAVHGHGSKVAIGDSASQRDVLALSGELGLGMLHCGGLVAVVVAGHAGVSELARTAEGERLGLGCHWRAHATLELDSLTVHGELGARRAPDGAGHSKDGCKAEHVWQGRSNYDVR